jgi:carboxypeptidase PM20D1
MKWIFGALLALVLDLAGVVGVNTAGFALSAKDAPVALADAPGVVIDRDAAAKRLGAMLQFRNVSVQLGQTQDLSAFTAQRARMESAYPAFHRAAQREVVNGESLLFTWQGTDKSLAPILLLAHLDVVPVERSSLSVWTSDPFGGAVKDGYVWGRGAIDNKGSVVALLEAAEASAENGFQPKRTILFAFGHDEEVSGLGGAGQIAALLKQRGVKAWFALDEGQAAIVSHPMTGKPAALIGIAEKGYATLRITAIGPAGHSSMPPQDMAVTELAQAILNIKTMKLGFGLSGGPAEDMARALAAQMPLTTRMVVANEWLFAPVIRSQLGASPAAVATMRTTIAPTMLEGSPKENIIPGQATALINFRLHPRDTTDTLMAAAQRAVAGFGRH